MISVPSPTAILGIEGRVARVGPLTAVPLHRVELIESEAAFLALEPWWDRLLEQSGTRSPFLRWDWVRLWWEEQKNHFDLAIAVARDARGEPRAVAPWVLGRASKSARRHLRHLAFLGGLGEIRSQRLDLIVPRGEEPTLTPILCETLRQLRPRWDAVRLNALPEASPNLPHLLKALQDCGSGAGVLNRYESRFTELPGTWDEFEMRQSGNWRSQMRRKWKAMEKQLGGRMRVAGGDLSPDAAMEALALLHGQRFSEEVSEFLRPAIQRFHVNLARRWMPLGRALMPYLEIDGRPAGAIYGFLEDNTFYHYQMGWDPRYSRISMGKLALAWSIRCAMARGVKRYDMLPGDFDYKTQWCEAAVHQVDLEAFHPASPRAAVFRSLRAVKRHLRGPDTRAHNETASPKEAAPASTP